MTKVVQKVKELESGTSPLSFAPLTQPAPLRWSLDEVSVEAGANVPLLELHVLPMDFAGCSARELEGFGTSLTDRIRQTGTVRSDVAMTPSSFQTHATVSIPVSRPRTWDTARPGELVEVRLHKSCQVSLRATLPRDSMGSILDQEALPQQTASLLRFVLALGTLRLDGWTNIAQGLRHHSRRPGRPLEALGIS
ncbi:hypothetical protein [Streptomyces neyagawaensis]|uniref:hypothetical protein n=1 Tax=Streptomyces neyagawaensis TaxID=42238 RepID=UPI0006E19529|nr:hypothetical protein [Streptomyces neyagawaensis]MCL6735074.1 hypothetical protein [Streptomyces neyagawaensis]MDE1687469.1 hypothetical protein [Streptomyces neyagawaensis]